MKKFPSIPNCVKIVFEYILYSKLIIHLPLWITVSFQDEGYTKSYPTSYAFLVVFELSLTNSLHSFHKHASRKIKHLNETYAKMEDAYKEICTTFSENPKTTEPSEFFGIFSKFIKEWKVRENLILIA